MEELLVERLVAVSGAHRKEDIAADELVDDLAVGGETLEREVDLFEGHLNLLDVPVDAPCLHRRKVERPNEVPGLQVEKDQAVERDADELLQYGCATELWRFVQKIICQQLAIE